MLDIFNHYRQRDGVIDLDSISNLEKIDKKTYGSRDKQRFLYHSNLVLFREEKLSFESIKEIINEEIALQYGIENASYDLAKYHGKYGTISLDFRDGKEFIPFLFLLFKRPKISNDFITLCDILKDLEIEHEDLLIISHILFKNYLLDIFTAQRDRNVSNQGFLYDGGYNLAPRYDSAGSFLTLTARHKLDKFCNDYSRDMLIKYKGYRSKFTLYPETVKMDAISVLLDIKYSILKHNNFYLGEVFKSLDSELDGIYQIDLSEVFRKMEFYNIVMEDYFKRFIRKVFEVKKKEYEEKEKTYSLFR